MNHRLRDDFCVNYEAFISELLVIHGSCFQTYESTDESFVLKAAKCKSHSVRRNESEAIEDSRWAGRAVNSKSNRDDCDK